MPKATTVEKSPRIIKVGWTNFDEWDSGNPRLFSAWIAESALRTWLDGLAVTEAWDIQVAK